MPTRRRSIRWIALSALFVFMGFVVYRSLHLQGVRCEVCITYHGLSQCRTVEGERQFCGFGLFHRREISHPPTDYSRSAI